MSVSDVKTRQSHAFTHTVTVTTGPSGSKMERSEDMRGFNLLFCVTEVVGLVMVILMAVWTSTYRGGFAWRSDPTHEFNWHPLLYTIGMIYLFANSILVYRALRTIRKKTLKLIHTGIHTAVVILSIVAFIAVLDSHNLPAKPIPNFYSLHSWMGIGTMFIYGLQWLVGIAAFLYPGFPMSVRGALMPIHVFLGLMAFILAIATACTGLTEKAIFSVSSYNAFVGETYIVNFLGVSFIVFGTFVVYLATNDQYKRHPRPEDSGLLSNSSD